MTARFSHHAEPLIEEKITLTKEWKVMKALLERVAADHEPLFPLIEEIETTLANLKFKPIDWEKLKV